MTPAEGIAALIATPFAYVFLVLFFTALDAG